MFFKSSQLPARPGHIYCLPLFTFEATIRVLQMSLFSELQEGVSVTTMLGISPVPWRSREECPQSNVYSLEFSDFNKAAIDFSSISRY